MFGNVKPSVEEVQHRVSATRWRTRGIFGGISVTLDILARGSVSANCVTLLRDIFVGFIYFFFHSELGDRKSVTMNINTRNVNGNGRSGRASRLRGAPTTLFDYLKSLARMSLLQRAIDCAMYVCQLITLGTSK